MVAKSAMHAARSTVALALALASSRAVAVAQPAPAADQPRAEMYMEATGLLATEQSRVLAFSMGARIGPCECGLIGPNLRFGLTARLSGEAPAEFLTFGVEGEGNVPVAAHVRLGLEASATHGTEAGGVDNAILLSAGAVARYEFASVHVDAFRGGPNGFANGSSGAMIGIGVGGSPRWYHVAGLAVSFGLAAFLTCGFGAGCAK